MTASLLDGVRLGSVPLRNRLGLGPINPGFGNVTGDSIADFYGQYSRAGVGLVYVGGVAVDLDARANSHSLTMRDADDARLLRAIADEVRRDGSVLAVQLMHAGRQASGREIGARTVAASAVACDVVREVPAQATADDLRRIVASFRNAAIWAERSGAQVVEVHAAHGYLISGFLSPSSNFRTDAYGGGVHNRFRLLREIIAEVREATQGAVGLRVNVAENAKSAGLTLCDLAEGLAPLLDRIDFVSVSGGVYTRDEDWIIPARSLGPALWRRQAAVIRRLTGKPVLLAGNVDSAELADELVADGSADVVLMVRSLLADPLILRKWLDRGEAAQPCTELLLCKYHSRGATNIYCPHNPVLRQRFRPKVNERPLNDRPATVRQREPQAAPVIH